MRIDMPPLPAPDGHKALRAKAEEMEARFLAEMLRHAGAGPMASPFGGGIGEEQFDSFLREAQAEAMVQAGGVGLAEQIVESLAQRGAA